MSDKSSERPSETSTSADASAHIIGDTMRQLGSSWAASADAVLAWSDTWRSIMASRGTPVGDAMLKTMSEPGVWPTALVPVLDEVRAALSLPKFADLPGLDASALPSPVPFFNLMKVCQEYALIGVPVWLEACHKFQEQAAIRNGADGASASAGDLLDVWNNVLDRTLMEFNRSGEFASVQQRVLHAAVQHRQEVRGAFEKAASAVDLPTRTEMVDVYRRLHDLTREVHALRRELRTLRKTRGTEDVVEDAPAHEAAAQE